MSRAERPATGVMRWILPCFPRAVVGIVAPVGTALAEFSDKVEDARASHATVTAALLLLSALTAASGWRRALLLWPVTLFRGSISFGTVWEWRSELEREGASALVWEGGAMAGAMLLGPPPFAVLARQWNRIRVWPG